MAGCVQGVVGEKNFLFQFKDGKNREMGSCSLMQVCSEEELGDEVNDPIYDLQKKGRLLTIDGNTADEGKCMF